VQVTLGKGSVSITKANRKFSFYAKPALHKLENLRFAPLLDRQRTGIVVLQTDT